MAQYPRTEVIGQRRTNWWLVLGGVVLVIFAIGTFAAPAVFLELLTILAGFGFLFSGCMGIATFVRTRHLPGAGWPLFMGILDIIVGGLMLVHPVVFAPVFPWLLGVSFIAFGVLEAGGAIPLGMYLPESRTMMVISGVLTIVVGVMFVIWPSSLSIWVAAFALIRGITLVVAGFTARVE